MQNPAPADHPIHELLRQRWSSRSFDPRPLPGDVVERLLEAARWSPSSFNEQPWRFVFAMRDDREAFDRIFDTLAEGNRRWAGNAGLLMVAACKNHFEYKDKPNRHAGYDLGASVAMMSLQATEEGLTVHQMAGFDRARAREVLGIPEAFEPMTAIAIGYPAPSEALPEDLQLKERGPRRRQPLAEIAFRGKWGEAV